MLDAGGLTDFEFDTCKITWRTRTLDPVLRSFWNWGNMAALPQAVQDRIEASTRESLEFYEEEGEYALPHEALLGSAAKP